MQEGAEDPAGSGNAGSEADSPAQEASGAIGFDADLADVIANREPRHDPVLDSLGGVVGHDLFLDREPPHPDDPPRAHAIGSGVARVAEHDLAGSTPADHSLVVGDNVEDTLRRCVDAGEQLDLLHGGLS